MNIFPRRKFLTTAGTLIAAPFCNAAHAQAPYPSRPVKLVIGFPAGGATDTLGRLLASHAAMRLSQPVIVENKPGAGTLIAADHVAKAAADGHTLFLTLSGALVNNTALYRNLPYNPGRDFTYLAMLATGQTIITVHKSVPASNLKELVTYARSGRNLSFGSWAAGSQGHILCEALNKSYQLSLLHVAYKGEAPVVQDLIGGQIQMAAGSFGSMAPHIASGALKVIGVVGSQRSAVMPELMTLLEQGATDPAFTTIGWIGLVGPAGMPRDIVERWAAIAREFLELPEARSKIIAYGFEPKFVPTDAFFRTWQADMPVWTKLINDLGVKLD